MPTATSTRAIRAAGSSEEGQCAPWSQSALPGARSGRGRQHFGSSRHVGSEQDVRPHVRRHGRRPTTRAARASSGRRPSQASAVDGNAHRHSARRPQARRCGSSAARPVWGIRERLGDLPRQGLRGWLRGDLSALRAAGRIRHRSRLAPRGSGRGLPWRPEGRRDHRLPHPGPRPPTDGQCPPAAGPAGPACLCGVPVRRSLAAGSRSSAAWSRASAELITSDSCSFRGSARGLS